MFIFSFFKLSQGSDHEFWLKEGECLLNLGEGLELFAHLLKH